MSLKFVAGQPFSAKHIAAMLNRFTVNDRGTGISTTSAAFVDFGMGDIRFVKTWDVTRVLVEFHVSWHYTGGASDTGVEWGLRTTVAGTPQIGFVALQNVGASHVNTSKVHSITDVPAGVYTDWRVQWRRTAGTGTLQWNTDDFASIHLSEIREL